MLNPLSGCETGIQWENACAAMLLKHVHFEQDVLGNRIEHAVKFGTGHGWLITYCVIQIPWAFVLHFMQLGHNENCCKDGLDKA